MITITKERLLTIKQWRETYGPGSNVVLPAEEAEELARIALASLEAEPIAWECGENIILFNPDTVEAYAKRAEISPKPLFSAPPALVVPDKLPREYIRGWPLAYSDYAEGWNDCREAMLQGKDDGILTNEGTKGDVQVRELTMLIKQLVSQLRKVKPDCKLPEKAMDYLKRNGLISAEDILR
ncbi:hypothetical protein [Escherichia coli]|uniref:hypothetical protein n=2 Tax=Escherichia coli TaxID=562 RepID=UPI0010D6D2EF|nr:hypothetical protein [Escherichia coli]GDO96305.1 hypothetical protein BvCmsNSNP012_00982 [Escherichia coli]